jgi:aspartate carbamoyltransferase catalytic subunit
MTWDKKHLIEIDPFSRKDIENISYFSKLLEPYSGIDKTKKRKQTDICQGDLMVLWFEKQTEKSTRTFGSFESAISRLGGDKKDFDELASSIGKGESISDTSRILSGQCDLIVDRHTNPQHIYNVSINSMVPVINAGNGSDQHPTQTLVDISFMDVLFGTVDGLTVAMVGDLKYGRTVHSLMKGLEKFNDVSIVGISPPGLGMPEKYTGKNYESRIIDMKNLNKELSNMGPKIVYATRIQNERLPEGEDPAKFMYKINNLTLRDLPEYTRIMHPLPRIAEIDPEIDKDSRAVYFQQAHYGVPVRMAIITSLLGYEDEVLELTKKQSF